MLSEIKYEKLPSYELGMEMGEKKVRKMIVSNLFENGMDIHTISNMTEISENEVKKIITMKEKNVK